MLSIIFIISVGGTNAAISSASCRGRSNHLRQDGGLCFEIPPWQHEPVQLDQHLTKLRATLGNITTSSVRRQHKPVLVNSEVNRYIETVIAPFLDAYHRNIQRSYQEMIDKLMENIKQLMNSALRRKEEIFKKLNKLADTLKIPAMCDEERRYIRTLATMHVAKTFACTEEARSDITEMAKYADQMIAITKDHMENVMENATRILNMDTLGLKNGQKVNISACLKELSRAAVILGFELDVSLTNARRHNFESCTKLEKCGADVEDETENKIEELDAKLYQCVDA